MHAERLASVLVSATVVLGTGLVGSGMASTNIAPPKSAALPAVSGAPVVGQTLTAASGSWTGSGPIAFDYVWQRCDVSGSSCAALSAATGQTYLLTGDDVGQTIRVQVTASNAVGSASALSSATAVVAATPPPGAVRVAGGRLSIPVAAVVGGDRLAIASVHLVPTEPAVGRPFVVQLRVGDTAGYLVRGALVSVSPLPSGVFAVRTDVVTRADGSADVTLRPTRLLALDLHLGAALFVQARRPGDSASAAASTSTLVALPLATGALAGNPYATAGRGYDLSYPDCSRRRPAQAGFAILGVNGGRPFTFNPCLAGEYGWYRGTGPQAVYVNTSYDPALGRNVTGPCALAHSGLTGRAAQAYAIGCSETAVSFERALLLGMSPSLWWLDVEPSNRWSANPQLNVALLRGTIDFLHTLSPSPIVGVYSRASWWQRITGGWPLRAPEWIPGAAGAGCATPFARGPVWLSQGGSSTLDEDVPC